MTYNIDITIPFDKHRKYIQDRYSLIYIGLYGSQNYDLHTSESDIDSKALIMPSVKDIALGSRAVSRVEKFEDGGQCDVKDVREMIKNFLKQNVNFLEILFTDYYMYNPTYVNFVEFLRNNAERIAHYDPMGCVRAMHGMAKEKYKAMEHPYPGTIEKIEKWGYDPKQVHHIVRLREFMEDYIKGKPFAECLKPTHKPYLMKIKNGDFELAAARQIALTELEAMARLRENFKAPVDDELTILIEEKLVELFCTHFREA